MGNPTMSVLLYHGEGLRQRTSQLPRLYYLIPSQNRGFSAVYLSNNDICKNNNERVAMRAPASLARLFLQRFRYL